MTYKTLVAGYLQDAADTGLTCQEIADRLDVGKGSYASMLMSARYPTTLLSPTRIPALTKLCGLGAAQVVALMTRRIADHPNSPFEMSTAMYRLLLSSTVQAVDAIRASRATPSRSSHAC